jgi:hypothetical protein
MTFSGIDKKCQYLKIDFATERFISQHNVSVQSEPLLDLDPRLREKAKRKYIEIIRIFRA